MNDNRNIRVLKSFISESERKLLLEKAEAHYKNGEFIQNTAGPHRYVMRLDSPEEMQNKLLEQLHYRIVKTFGLEGCPLEPVLNRLISRIDPGGHIHKHLDELEVLARSRPNIKAVNFNGENFRCNIMVQMLDESAYPVIDDASIAIEQCDAWGFLPSIVPHGTHTIKNKTRIIYGFGYIVPKGYTIKGN